MDDQETESEAGTCCILTRIIALRRMVGTSRMLCADSINGYVSFSLFSNVAFIHGSFLFPFKKYFLGVILERNISAARAYV